MRPRCFCFTVLFSLLTAPIFAVDWEKQTTEDANQDKVVLAFDGVMSNRMVCDTVLRVLPDGRIALYFLAERNKEPRFCVVITPSIKSVNEKSVT